MQKKSLYVLAGLIIILVLLEAGLRIGDYFTFKGNTTGDAESDKDSITILAVGDSFTIGAGAKEGNDYPAVLQKLLSASGGRKYDVRKYGIEGANSSQILNELPAKINELKPDILILLIGGANSLNQVGYRDAGSEFLNSIHVYKLISQWFQSSTVKPSGGEISAEKSSSDISKWIKSDIVEIIELCEKGDIKLIIQNYPIRDSNESKFSLSYQQANLVIKDIVKEYSISFVDNKEVFDKLGTQKDRFFEPAGQSDHCSDYGYEIIAKNLYITIMQLSGEGTVEMPTASVDKENLGRDIIKINEEIESHPDSIELYQKRAELYMIGENLGMAIKDLNKIIEKKPSSVDAYNKRGTIRAQQKEFALALQDYSKAIELDPKSGFAYSNRGHVYMDLGQNEKAIADFDRSIEIDPNNFDSFNNRGYLQSQMGNYEAAISDFNKIIQMKPEHPFAYNNRGFAKYKLNDLDGALKDINKSIELFRDNSYTYRNRALVYIAMGKTQNACDDLQAAKKLGFTESFGPEVDQLIDRHCN